MRTSARCGFALTYEDGGEDGLAVGVSMNDKEIDAEEATVLEHRKLDSGGDHALR